MLCVQFNFFNFGIKWPLFIILSVEIEMNISLSQLLNVFVRKHELQSNNIIKVETQQVRRPLSQIKCPK